MKRKACDDHAEQSSKRQQLPPLDESADIQSLLFLNTGKEFFLGTTPGIAKDYVQAKSNFIKAMNHPEALIYLGYIHEFGLETPVDMMKAFKYYRKARIMGADCPKIYNGINTELLSRFMNASPIEACTFLNFLSRFPLQSKDAALKENPHPAFALFISYLETSGVAELCQQGIFGFPLWNTWCIFQQSLYKDTQVEFYIWGLQATDQSPVFFKSLFEKFPFLQPDNITRTKFLTHGAAKHRLSDYNKILIMEQKLENSNNFSYDCGLTFFKVMKFNGMPKELTQRILEEVDDLGDAYKQLR